LFICPNFIKVKRQREEAWLEAERPRNEEALKLMRTLLPPNVARLSFREVQAAALDAYGLTEGTNSRSEVSTTSQPFDFDEFYPYEFAAYLKDTALLHWLVARPDDIKRANFLVGDSAKYFNDLESYDVTELRAVAA
jgi:hypothetical protein